MCENKRPLGITDVVLRDASQSLLATRVRLEDMLPIAAKLDEIGRLHAYLCSRARRLILRR